MICHIIYGRLMWLCEEEFVQYSTPHRDTEQMNDISIHCHVMEIPLGRAGCVLSQP